MTPLRVTALHPDNLDGLRDALAASGLPVADLVDFDRTFFRFDDDVGLAGYGGLEGHGADRLLRSILVVADRRGYGLGRVMLGLLEARARELGVSQAVKLTGEPAPRAAKSALMIPPFPPAAETWARTVVLSML